MGQRRRAKPGRLAEKPLAIRQELGVSQSQLAKLFEFDEGFARISEYEHGNREPDLIVLLNYAKLARVSLEILTNDNLELRFRKIRGVPDFFTYDATEAFRFKGREQAESFIAEFRDALLNPQVLDHP